MTSKQFNNNIENIYKAIRKTYGYTGEADELVDMVGEMADVLEDKFITE